MIGFTNQLRVKLRLRNVRVTVTITWLYWIGYDKTLFRENERYHAPAQVPMKQVGQAEEVAEVAAFLAGQNISQVKPVPLMAE